MNRREILQSGIAMTLASAGTAIAQSDKSVGAHEHHDHGGVGKYAALAAATADCGRLGEVCIAHCLVLLGQGNKSMAACAASVSQMLATCDALLKLSAQNSKYVPKLAAVALAACQDCEKECRKHEKDHRECKDCAESCVTCAAECKKVAA